MDALARGGGSAGYASYVGSDGNPAKCQSFAFLCPESRLSVTLSRWVSYADNLSLEGHLVPRNFL